MRYPTKYVLITDMDNEEYEKKCRNSPPVPITEKSINDLSNSASMQLPILQSASMPESLWHDCITNPHGKLFSSVKTEQIIVKEEHPNQNTNNDNTTTTNSILDYVDPTQKTSCSCVK